jgi:general secretion pathway protein D
MLKRGIEGMKMTKTNISALLVVLLASAQVVQAQESVDDIFAQLDAATSGKPYVAPVAPAPAEKPANAATGTGKVVAGSNKVAARPQGAQAPAAKADAMDQLFNRGIEFYDAGKLDEAMTVFETILSLDKYNSRANSYKRRTAQRLMSQATKEQEASRAVAITAVDAAWNNVPKALTKVEESKEVDVQDPDQVAIAKMEARLKSIMIPSMDFTDASIEDVVGFLSLASRRDGGSDVDFMVVGSVADGGGITVSIRDMSLYDALQFVVGMASLKFEVTPNVVSIMPVNYVPLSAMELKSYDISPSVGEELVAASDDSGAGADNLFGDSSSDSSETGPANVAAFFSTVDFPQGASAIYHPRFNKLFIRNTSKNIKEVEVVLDMLAEEAILRDSQQVEIEAKFVEFNEGALEELGFDWNVYGSGNVASMGLDPRNVAGGFDPNTGQAILQNGAAGDGRPGQSLMGVATEYDRFGNPTSAVSTRRTNETGFETVKEGLLGLMGGAPASMMMGNGDIDLKITALEQEGTADILSAPKVTTKSGSEATIRIAETHRYPQDYNVETGQRTSPVVTPQDWEDYDLGVTLKVTPVVNPESNSIDLDLFPEIIKFNGWDNYLVGFNAFDSSGGNSPDYAGDGSALMARMPYFERRSVQTQATIDDGQTVVMGGMVDERTETFRDQVPFLGDIPYVGRLFRNEGSRSVKKNLVILVKATLVDTHGMSRAEREMQR